MTSRTYAQSLKVAATLVGGYDNLQEHLGVGPEDMQSWLSGHHAPPHDVFLRVVDILLEHNGY